MASLSATLTLLLIAFMSLVQATAVHKRNRCRHVCELPIWTVKNLEVTFSNDTFVPGNATFTVVSSLVNKPEPLKCEVPFNYGGRINGTPENKDLNIKLQFNIDTGTVTFNQTWSCGNANTTSNSTLQWAIGYAEFPLRCPEPTPDVFACTAETLIVDSTLESAPRDDGAYK